MINFIFNIYKWFRMGLADKLIKQTDERIENKVDPLLNYFSVAELEALLLALNNSTFYTKTIEPLYSGIYKLQKLRDDKNSKE